MTLRNQHPASDSSGIRLRGSITVASGADDGLLPQSRRDFHKDTKRRSGRRKMSRRWFSKYVLGTQHRRLLHQNRNPKLVQTLAMAALALALLICLGLASFFHAQLDTKTTVDNSILGSRSNKNKNVIEPKVKNVIEPRGASQDLFGILDAHRAAEIIFRGPSVSMNPVSLPLRDIDENAFELPEYGELVIQFFENDDAVRNIMHDYQLDLTEYRDPDDPQDDDVEGYYDFDDDFERNKEAYGAKDKKGGKSNCRRISEHRLSLQNCNNFHELGLLESDVTYLGEGAYRQVFALEHAFQDTSENIVIKDLHNENEMKVDMFEFVRMDAIVAERTSSNPRTFDIYGFCGVGILSELFLHGDVEDLIDPVGNIKQEDLHDEDEVKPQNNLTSTQKLVIALEMAEGLAVLHGYKNGLIIHDDVQLAQYLFNADFTMLKLNDFNRAEFPLFNEQTNEYCLYTNGHGHGNWRAPEEYKDAPLTEKIDVWSLGNNLYSLLTGLDPLYEIKTGRKFEKKIVAGETAFLDPRYREKSNEEAKLVEIIEKCFTFDPNDRPSIFEVVDFLRKAVDELVGKGTEARQAVLKEIADIPIDDSDDEEEAAAAEKEEGKKR